MRHTWRWFGPVDKVSIADARQAGAKGIVTALHHVPYGTVWSPEEIARRQREVAMMPNGSPSTLAWEVVESLPISEAIKTQTGPWRDHIANYRVSMQNLAAAGLEVICYNFMPVLDWTRTQLRWDLPNGARTMRFDLTDFAAFDIHVLQRANAAADYPGAIVEEAGRRAAAMSDKDKSILAGTVNAGLPGATEDNSLDGLRLHLASYAEIDTDRLRDKLADFLSEIIPLAEKLGLRFGCHPDDPPFPLMGLPRIMSTEADYAEILRRVDSPANGVTLCTGSLGARPDNDLPGMVERFGPKIHFLHLRNVHRESDVAPGSFYEDEHLTGDTDMVAVVAAVLREEARRKAEGRADWQIPIRPDHGQDILDDHARAAQAGYPAIGRLKGLAELRGLEMGLAAQAVRQAL